MYSKFKIGVRQYHEGVVTAELEGNMLEVFTATRLASNDLTYRGRTGERNEAWDGVRHEVVADFCTCSHNHAEHP
ncbi:hypothetical protein D3C87_1832190 [compost metagenome]